MSRSRPPLDVRALLDQERAIPPVPAPVRARALARARAALVAGRVTSLDGFVSAPRTRWGVVVAVACAASAAIGATAYEMGVHHRPIAGDHPAAPTITVVETSPVPSTPTTPIVVVPSSAPAPAVPPRRSSPAAPAPEELRLLQQARAAVARQDFAAALPLIAEHAREFKNGRLAEEREALRVRALSGLGRTEEAQHAADAFGSRFPRSVLLPAVSRMPASTP
ncbi:MAG TPA: hypothetical protein VH142_25685 [Polyangiaceae bacterium]|jgi:hypothetical protein|nr:hypothetical protein [Polyangiaceae bacterium]